MFGLMPVIFYSMICLWLGELIRYSPIHETPLASPISLEGRACSFFSAQLFKEPGRWSSRMGRFWNFFQLSERCCRAFLLVGGSMLYPASFIVRTLVLTIPSTYVYGVMNRIKGL